MSFFVGNVFLVGPGGARKKDLAGQVDAKPNPDESKPGPKPKPKRKTKTNPEEASEPNPEEADPKPKKKTKKETEPDLNALLATIEAEGGEDSAA